MICSRVAPPADYLGPKSTYSGKNEITMLTFLPASLHGPNTRNRLLTNPASDKKGSRYQSSTPLPLEESTNEEMHPGKLRQTSTDCESKDAAQCQLHIQAKALVQCLEP